MSNYDAFPVRSEFRDKLLADLGEPIQDVDAWCENALEEAIIAELAEKNRELFLSFASTLGEMAARKAGLDLTPLNERGRE